MQKRKEDTMTNSDLPKDTMQNKADVPGKDGMPAKVGIVMGSDSDMPVMAKAADILEELGISYEMKIISAHREPDVFFEYAKSAEEKGLKVIIAGAGMAAHLPGMCAAIFPLTFCIICIIINNTKEVRLCCCGWTSTAMCPFTSRSGTRW